MAPSNKSPFCDKMRQHFDDYRDEELSALLQGVVSKHLKSCDGCRREYRLFEATLALVKSKSAPDVPVRLLRKVIKELQSGGTGGTPAKSKVDPRLGLEGTT